MPLFCELAFCKDMLDAIVIHQSENPLSTCSRLKWIWKAKWDIGLVGNKPPSMWIL